MTATAEATAEIAPPVETFDVFVYGTLMNRAKIEHVIRHEYREPMLAATIKGYRRVQPADLPFPVMVEQTLIYGEKASAALALEHGMIATGLTAADVALLDQYEGVGDSLYTRERTYAMLDRREHGATRFVHIYIAGPAILIALGGIPRVEITDELRINLISNTAPNPFQNDDMGEGHISKWAGHEWISGPTGDTIECPNCYQPVRATAEQCPECGEDMDNARVADDDDADDTADDRS